MRRKRSGAEAHLFITIIFGVALPLRRGALERDAAHVNALDLHITLRARLKPLAPGLTPGQCSTSSAPSKW